MEVPVNIKRYRERKFTEKRDNYKNYNNAKWDWNDIFAKIENKERCKKEIAKAYNIKYKTLLDKYKKWVDNEKKKIIKKENRGGHKKIFTIEQEKDLALYIKDVYIANGLFFDNECIKILALKKYKLLCNNNKNKTENDNKFNCSDGWVNDFKKKWKLTTKGYNYNKVFININDDKIKAFLNKCFFIDHCFSKTLVFNLDETFWLLVNNSSTVIGIKGEHRKVSLAIDEKSGYTAVFIISASGIFMKPIIILKGLTNRCLYKINNINDNKIYKKFSSSGWIDESIMFFILDEIVKITACQKTIIFLDNYSVHTMESINNYAKNLNIIFEFIPAYTTSKYQPLDVKINGPIKAIGKNIAKELFLENPFSTPTLCSSINCLIEAKDKISSELIVKSFRDAYNFTNY